MKRRYKAMNIMLVIGVSLWIIETVFFLIRDGWHMKAISSEEQMLDYISETFINIGIILFASMLLSIVKMFVNAKTTEISVEP